MTTTTLTIRLPVALARELKKRSREAGATPTAILRQAAAEYVRQPRPPSSLNTMQAHIKARAGTWDGYCTGAELLRKTRP